jgi:hypothetical protein
MSQNPLVIVLSCLDESKLDAQPSTQAINEDGSLWQSYKRMQPLGLGKYRWKGTLFRDYEPKTR